MKRVKKRGKKREGKKWEEGVEEEVKLEKL